MTISIPDTLASRLRDRANQEGCDLETIAEYLLATALDWESQDRTEAIAGIQGGLDAVVAGRVRPAAEVFADMKSKSVR